MKGFPGAQIGGNQRPVLQLPALQLPLDALSRYGVPAGSCRAVLHRPAGIVARRGWIRVDESEYLLVQLSGKGLSTTREWVEGDDHGFPLEFVVHHRCLHELGKGIRPGSRERVQSEHKSIRLLEIGVRVGLGRSGHCKDGGFGMGASPGGPGGHGGGKGLELCALEFSIHGSPQQVTPETLGLGVLHDEAAIPEKAGNSEVQFLSHGAAVIHDAVVAEMSPGRRDGASS